MGRAKKMGLGPGCTEQMFAAVRTVRQFFALFVVRETWLVRSSVDPGLDKPSYMRRSSWNMDHPLGREFVPRNNNYEIIRKAKVKLGLQCAVYKLFMTIFTLHD